MLRCSAVSTANLSSGTHAQAKNIAARARLALSLLAQFKIWYGTLYLGEGGS